MFELLNMLEVNCDSIPEELTNMLNGIVTLIQIGVPIILIIMGMIDMGKAVASQKEDEIKKAQSMLIKRVIYAVVVFLVIAIVEFVLGFVGDSASEALQCIKTIFNRS